MGVEPIRFPELEDLDAVYVHTPAGQLFVEEGGEVDWFHVAFQHLLGAAASTGDTIALIVEMARSLPYLPARTMYRYPILAN